MKRIFVATVALMLMAGRMLAQDDVGGAQAELIKQKAMHLRDVNNQQQGITPSSPGTPPGPGTFYQTPATPSAPQGGMNPAQQALIDRLETDLKVVKPGVPVTPEQKRGLQIDFASLAKGANKPSAVAVTKLTADLADALADKAVTPKDLGQLGKAINIVMNCAPITQARAQSFVTAAQTILKSSGVNEAGVKLVGSDLTAIVIEIQKSKPKLYQ